MDMLLRISIAVIAIAFVIFLYSLIQTLKIVRATVDELRLTVRQLRTEATQITVEMKEAIHNTNAMTLDARAKLSSLDVLFSSVNDIGHTIQTFTGAAKESAVSLAAANKNEGMLDSKKERVLLSTIVDGISSALRIWGKIKKI